MASWRISDRSLSLTCCQKVVVLKKLVNLDLPGNSRAAAISGPTGRVTTSCYASSCCCGGTSGLLSLLSFPVGTSPAGAVPAGTVCSGIASVLRRAISAAKVSIIDASSTVRGHNSTCTACGASFEYPNVYLRHPRCSFPLIATVTLIRGSESARTRASWNARFSSLYSFSLLACHDLNNMIESAQADDTSRASRLHRFQIDLIL